MKTAIVIVGQVRTLDRCLANQHWYAYRHFPDADFFVSTVHDSDAGKLAALTERYGEKRVKIDAVLEQPDCVAELRKLGVKLPDEWHRGTPYTHEGFPISVHPQAVLRQLWQLNAAWEAFPQLKEYDCVIRTRPDLFFQSVDGLPDDVGYLRSAFSSYLGAAVVPNWGSFGGINDRFALLDKHAAEAYLTTYKRIKQLTDDGCPVHPESLIRASLERADIHVIPCLRAYFATLRANGELRHPEITGIDLLNVRA